MLKMEDSTRSAANETPATFFEVCLICHKPFTKEYSFNRHVSYCRRAKAKRKNRPRSCRCCYISKTKCSLARPQCSRCQAQGLECIYEGPIQPPSTGVSSRLQQQNVNEAPAPSHDESFVSGTLSSTYTTNPYNTSFSSSDMQQSRNERDASYSYTERTPFPHDNNSWQTALNFISSSQNEHDEVQSRASTELMLACQVFTKSKFAAGILSQAISAFPQMMLRRQTFPPFIHAHWHLPSLPETLASCMSIAQLFATRTPETRPFLWRTIGIEIKRLRDEVESASILDLQNALQAVILFLIMAIVDQDSGTLSLAPNLFQAFRMLCCRSRDLLGGSCFTYPGEALPDTSWEDWIYAETRRRIICVWFLISRIIAVQAGGSSILEYPISLLPVISHKTLWEARSTAEWQTEKALYDASDPMSSFEELVKAKRRSNEPYYRRKLETWDAGADKMGVLLSIAAELI
ncbi:hypothetical protein ACQKWADRAFT_282592 [Trichoderma austrokoningii]